MRKKCVLNENANEGNLPPNNAPPLSKWGNRLNAIIFHKIFSYYHLSYILFTHFIHHEIQSYILVTYQYVSDICECHIKSTYVLVVYSLCLYQYVSDICECHIKSTYVLVVYSLCLNILLRHLFYRILKSYV